MGFIDEIKGFVAPVAAVLGQVVAAPAVIGAGVIEQVIGGGFLAEIGLTGAVGIGGAPGAIGAAPVAAIGPTLLPLMQARQDPVVATQVGPMSGVSGSGVLDVGVNCPPGVLRLPHQNFTLIVALFPDGSQCVTSLERGTPFLMSRDFQTAKRVIKAIGDAHGRIPRKTVKQGTAAQLTEAIKDKALRLVTGDACPPKC